MTTENIASWNGYLTAIVAGIAVVGGSSWYVYYVKKMQLSQGHDSERHHQ